MPGDPRIDMLFEPVRIGPKLARNRFFHVTAYVTGRKAEDGAPMN